jgi:regulator of replication initiation timing
LVYSEGEPVRFVASERAALPPEVNPMPTEQQFTDLNQKFTDLEQKFTAVVAERDQLKTESAGLATRVSTMEADTRHKAFTDEVMGRSDANNIRWFGDVETHVAVLESFGDNAELRAKYIAEQRGSAQRMSAAIGTEKGSDARITASDALGQLQAKAQKYAEEKGVTFEAAMDAVSQANPDLYRKYQAEKRG